MRATRRDDHDTSVAAFTRLAADLGGIRAQVLALFVSRGPMNDDELIAFYRGAHPEEKGRANSTIRKRRTELYQAGVLVKTGQKRRNARDNLETVWGLARRAPGASDVRRALKPDESWVGVCPTCGK